MLKTTHLIYLMYAVICKLWVLSISNEIKVSLTLTLFEFSLCHCSLIYTITELVFVQLNLNSKIKPLLTSSIFFLLSLHFPQTTIMPKKPINFNGKLNLFKLYM
jgi:hypothetical protein